jgi:hypothetical protein
MRTSWFCNNSSEWIHFGEFLGLRAYRMRMEYYSVKYSGNAGHICTQHLSNDKAAISFCRATVRLLFLAAWAHCLPGVQAWLKKCYAAA